MKCPMKYLWEISEIPKDDGRNPLCHIIIRGQDGEEYPAHLYLDEVRLLQHKESLVTKYGVPLEELNKLEDEIQEIDSRRDLSDEP